MRTLAIDIGGKRTGLAVGSDAMRIATPLKMIDTASDALRLAGIQQAIDEHGPDELVVGLPINMDGSEGPAAKNIRKIAKAFESLGLPIHFVDERKTSEAANATMAQTGLTYGQKKARRDSLAACEILKRYWDPEAEQ